MFTYEMLFTKTASRDPEAVRLAGMLKSILHMQDEARTHGWPEPTMKFIDQVWEFFEDSITMFKYAHERDGFLYQLADDVRGDRWAEEVPRLRRVIGTTDALSWAGLIGRLRWNGFMIDHFHVVEEMDGREYVSHLNVFFDRNGNPEEARWDSGGTEIPLDESPQGYARISADVWHDH